MSVRKDILISKKKLFGIWYQYFNLQKPQKNDIKLTGKVLKQQQF